MNIAELERLLHKCEVEHDPHAWYDLEQMAPYLARRVIAAEKLVEAVRGEREMACQDYDLQRKASKAVDEALRVYEATK